MGTFMIHLVLASQQHLRDLQHQNSICQIQEMLEQLNKRKSNHSLIHQNDSRFKSYQKGNIILKMSKTDGLIVDKYTDKLSIGGYLIIQMVMSA